MSAHQRPIPLSRRLFHGLRTEGGGAGRDAAALGFGFFIGCTPFYGLHLLLVFAVGWLFRLNRLKMYIAANVSNPLFAPFLVLAEIQLGAWLRRGDLHDLNLEAIRNTNPWTFGIDLLLGSLVIGLLGGAAIAAATWATARSPGPVDDLLAAAADRYLKWGLVGWEFARGKLRGDPVYREVLGGRVLSSGSLLVDVGCGQGLMLAALAEARIRRAEGRWPESAAEPPVFEQLIGIELRPRIAALARRALEPDVSIRTGDATAIEIPMASAILIFDVLHMLSRTEQEVLLRELRSRLLPGGTILVREANPAGGAAFVLVRLGNRLKAVVTGNWWQGFAFRAADDWRHLFDTLALDCETRDMSAGTPFANLLFRLTPRVSAPERTPQA